MKKRFRHYPSGRPRASDWRLHGSAVSVFAFAERVRNRVARAHESRSHDHGQLFLRNLKLIDLTRGKGFDVTTASVVRRLTKGILSRSHLIARRGSPFFLPLFRLIPSLRGRERARERERARRERHDVRRPPRQRKGLKCKTNLGRFKFNTVNDPTAHFAILRAASASSYLLLSPLFLCLFSSSSLSVSLPLSFSLLFSRTPTRVHTLTHVPRTFGRASHFRGSRPIEFIRSSASALWDILQIRTFRVRRICQGETKQQLLWIH